MKTHLRLLSLLCALAPLGAQAQGVCGAATNAYSFTAAANNNIDWKANSATVGLTTFTTSGFASTGDIAKFRTEEWIPNEPNDQRLIWEANYEASNGTSTVTFTFSQAVSNLEIVVSDIDRNQASGNSNYRQDAVTFNGYKTDLVSSATLIDLQNSNVVNSRTGLTLSGNTITDATNTDNGGGTTTVTFPEPVKKLVLVLSNTETAGNTPGSQVVGIHSLTWCKLTPTATNDALTTSYRSSVSSIDVLGNDTADGTFDVATLDLIPGTIEVDAVYTDDNGVTYTANPTTGLIAVTNSNNHVGSSALSYLVKDDAGQAATASFTLTLTNTAPVASDYQITRSYNISSPINLLAEVMDADGSTSIAPNTLDLNPGLARRQATYTVPNQGVFTVDDNGLVTFAALNGFVGTSSVSYTVEDEKGLISATKQLTLTTTSAAPIATADVATRSNTAKAAIYILANDTDVDDDLDPATVDLDPTTPARDITYTDGTKGTYSVDEFGLVSFTALNSFTGSSALSYLVRDAKGLASNTAVLTLTVRETLANDDSNVTKKGEAVSGNILINDNNKAGTNLTVSTTLVSGPATNTGTVTISSNGDYTYTPPSATYIGTTSFVYRVSDGTNTSTATVTILVYEPTSTCTVATGPNLLKNPDFTLGNTGFQTDYVYVANQPGITNELVPEGLYSVGNSAADYHPSFAQNGTGGTNDNFLMINGSNTIKKLYSQTIAVEPNKYYNFSAYVNNIISTASGTTLDDPEFGFVINGVSTSVITTIPESPDNWVKLEDIWFSGNSTTATFEIVNVSVAAEGNDMGIDELYFGTCNEAPVAVSDLVLAPPTVPTSFSIITNDVDDGGIQGSSVLLYPATGTGAGVKTLTTTEGTYTANTSTGMLTFTPVSGFTGSSTITYKGEDARSAVSNVASVTVRVGPITSADAQDMSGNRIATLNVTSNDQDVDGVDPATIDLDPTTPAQDLSRVVANVGVFQANAAGVVTFTPVSTFSGTASIPYTVRDYVGAISNQSNISVTLDKPLPVELTHFEATAKGTDVLTSWITASELNNDHFEVERSLDALSFAMIGSVRGKGNTTHQSKYSFTDAGAARIASRLYYRLKQVDFDGRVSFSPVQVVSFTNTKLIKVDVSVYPNPTQRGATLDLTGLPAGNYQVQVLDLTGRTLQQFTLEGQKEHPLPVQALSHGSYIVRVRGAAVSIALPLIRN